MPPPRPSANAIEKSVLDFVLEDANALKGQLGAADVRKLDEYLDSRAGTGKPH